MPDLLFLSHRIPYPPDKGEKIRAWHVLQHLAKRCRVHLGTFTLDDMDRAGETVLRDLCASVEAVAIDPRRQKARSLARARPGRPLMLDYYGSPALQRWVDRTMASNRMEAAYVFTAAMAPYVAAHRPSGTVLDLVDIDSEKWTAYAGRAGWPMRHVWAREGRTLLAYERRAVMAADVALLVTEAEVRRFEELAPETRGKVTWLENGVDLDRFSPGLGLASPYAIPGPHMVFAGHMDYWPNADAVQWFAAEVMPLLRRRQPRPQFHIVGANPGPAVLALGSQPDVHVTGRVDDARPYVAHADVSVSPLRIARGVQNKVLEAMALGRPVVASPDAAEGVRAQAGEELLVADGAQDYAARVAEVLDGRWAGLGQRARGAMEARYGWAASMARLDALMTRRA